VSGAYDKLILKSAFFKGLLEHTLDTVRGSFAERSARKGAFFFHEESPAEYIYLLAKGRVKVGQVSEDGQQVTMRVIVPGQVFGGMAVLGPRASYPVSAEAMEPSVALEWKGELLYELARRDPNLGLQMTELMYAHLQEIQSRFRELATERVERRVARALLRLAAQAGRKLEDGLLIDLPLSRQEVAEMTGTTLFTVSRLLTLWERRGLIRTGRQRVVIRDRDSLRKVAEDAKP
jgi:CRP/FNR family transcriptional regulator, nitrogen oxide reductase regulator